ncbi:hypothetical protein B566_EDAN012288 [Ephemera danica]|nr:hypothetical protein B566_EDAN012288 [Ephemera danica]
MTKEKGIDISTVVSCSSDVWSMNFYLLLMILMCLISMTWTQDDEEEQTEPTSFDELIATEENTEHVTHELEAVTEPHGPEADLLNNLEPQKGIAALLQAIGSMDPGSVNSYRCNMQNFVDLQRCCSSSPHQLFKGAVVFACSEGQSVVPRSALEDYVLNVGQHDDATINLTSTDTYAGSMLGNAVISEEGAIILASVRNHILRAVGQVWTIAALEALSNCSALVPGVHPEPIMRKSHRTEDVCLVQPFLLVQCLRHRMLLLLIVIPSWRD